MAHAKDLTGMRFGNLVVLRRAETPTHRSRNAFWVCRCDCGNEVTFASNDLQRTTKRARTHCGCKRKNRLDITGRTFGDIKVIRLATERRGRCGGMLWEIECTRCGRIDYLKGSQVRDNLSCGCRWRPDMAGQRFGRLVVDRYLGSGGVEGAVWLCRCDCGGRKATAAWRLRRGLVKSCGCLGGRRHGSKWDHLLAEFDASEAARTADRETVEPEAESGECR